METRAHTRWSVVTGMCQRLWFRVTLVIWALFGTYDTFVSQFLPSGAAEKFPRLYDLVVMTSGFLPWWGWLLILAAIFVAASIEYAHRKGGVSRSNEQEKNDGPVYWSLTETLSWVAFGEPKTAAQWAAICKADGLLIRPKEETEGFDQAEHKLFEALRARKLTAKGKKNKSEIYEDIYHNYFLSNVACQILHDVIDVNQKAGIEVYHWDGPKWRGVKLERQAVLKLWPRQK